MESDLQQHCPNRSVHLDEHQTKQMNSGLIRYQSAPSSLFSSFLDRDSLEEFLNRPTSPETERIFDRFLKSSENRNRTNTFFDQSFLEKKEKPRCGIKREREDQIRETEEMVNRKQSASGSGSGSGPGPGSVPGSFANPQLDRGSGSNLIRQSSSPVGFLSALDTENVYEAVMRGMGDISGGNTNYTINQKEEASSSRPLLSETHNKLNNSPELPPRTLSGSLSRSSWDEKLDSKTLTRGDRSLSGGLYQSQTKIEENAGAAAKRPPLAHHLSLPKYMSDIEKILESSDSVPWKIRAKRGEATHPRSIAERVRRTKISERMKRLQELVPNMDKQTNTSDMLDLAVEYIKDLQKQYEILLQNGAMCTCSSTQQKETKD